MAPDVATKRCPDCATDKPVEDFHQNPRTADGRQTYCKPCQNARKRQSTAERHQRALVAAPVTTPLSRWDRHGRVCDGCGQPETARDSLGVVLPLSLYGNNARGITVKAILCKLCSTGLSCARDDPGIVGRWLSILSVGVRQEARAHLEETP